MSLNPLQPAAMDFGPRVPGADDCLNAAIVGPLMAALIQAQGEPAVCVEGVQISKVRRSASKHRHPHPITLVYEVDVRDLESQRRSRRRFYGKLCRPGAIAAAPLPAQAWRLEALDLLLWPWPADPGLPQLTSLLDPVCTRASWGFAATQVEVLRYEPEVRATLVYTHAGQAGTERLFAKTFADERAQAVAARFSHFAQRAKVDPDAPRVAETLGVDASGRTLWQREVFGRPFDARELIPTPGARLALAHALAEVHQAPLALASTKVRDRRHWLAELARRHRKLTRVLPQLGPQVDALKSALECSAARLEEPALSLIHGDCHPGQFWLQGERVVVFDLDEVCLGDPMEDLAEFTVRLRREGDPLAWEPALVQAYAQVAPQRFDAHRLQWHGALQHLLQAARAFVFQAPGWRQQAEVQVARALDLSLSLAEEVGA